MIFTAQVKYGDPKEPVRMTLLKAILSLVFGPFAMVLQLIIMALAILLDILQVGMTHITFKVELRDIIMPDGELRKRT